ncbi:hypothetical protein FRC07_001516 [Ceratobasidium sp. 392]|nr:hypothetical protein FRC07_001516 [Ceratobasidium sp. 392]
MTTSEIILHLGNHGCEDISKYLRKESFSHAPIARGGLGDVYRGVLRDNSAVAIKLVRFDLNSTVKDRTTLKRTAEELHPWSQCKHPNVHRLLGLVVFRGQIGMVSPWVKNGDLRQYLGQSPGVNRCQLVHGDLKAANVLISDEGVPMLTDFGNATIKECGLQFTSTASATPFSPRWAAPEILDGNKCNNAGDVYALAMEVLTGKLPYHNMNDPAVIRSVMIDKKIPERPVSQIPTGNTHSDRLWKLLVDCWRSVPEERPTAATATKTVST